MKLSKNHCYIRVFNQISNLVLISKVCHQVIGKSLEFLRTPLSVAILLRELRGRVFKGLIASVTEGEQLMGCRESGECTRGVKTVIFSIAADTSLSVQWDQVVTKRTALAISCSATVIAAVCCSSLLGLFSSNFL